MAASGVNKRFVVMLVGALAVIAAGVALAALYVAKKDGMRNIRQGDALAAKGDWEGAAKAYSRGVNKDQSHVDWMEKWRDALAKVVPGNSTEFNDYYGMYRSVVLKIAQTKKTDVGSYEVFFKQLMDEFSSFGGGVAGWSSMGDAVERALAGFEIAKADPSSGWPALRRYRGIAVVNQFAADPTLDPAKVKAAKEDLESSLAILKKDLDTQSALVQWELLNAGKAEAAGRTDEAAGFLAAGEKGIARLESDFPDDAKAKATVLRFKIAMSNRTVKAGANQGEVIRARQERLASLKPEVEKLAAIVEATPADKLDYPRIEPLLSLAPVVDSKRGMELGNAAIARALSARGNDAELLLVSARRLSNQYKFEEAIAQFQKIADLPKLPVGLDGLRLFTFKQIALMEQASASLGLVGRAKDDGERKLAIDRAKGYRQKLASESVSAQSPELLLLDAKIKIAEGDNVSAQQMLAEHSRRTGDKGQDAVESLLMQGGIAAERGEYGRAREAFEKALSINPTVNPARLQLAGLLERLNEPGAALAAYREASALAPEDDGIKRKIEILDAILRGNAGNVKDPVDRILVEADIVAKGGGGKPADPIAAQKMVEGALVANKFDVKLVRYLLNQMGEKRAGEGVALVEKAVAAAPDNAELKELLAAIKVGMDPEQQIEQVKAQKLTPAEEAVAIYRIRRGQGRAKEALPELKRVFDSGAVDNALFDAYFVASFESGDMATAQAVADKAATTDVDKAGGRTFRARFLMMQNKPAEAEAMLRQLADTGAAPAAVWRLMSMTQQSQRRPQDALASITQAIKIQPNDLELHKMHIRLLDATGQTGAALAEATRLEATARHDKELGELIISLQIKSGQRGEALARRQRMQQEAPGDVGNATALAELFLDNANPVQAEEVLKKLEATGTNARLAFLRGRSLADRGQMDKAKEEFEGLIKASSVGGKPGVGPYLVYAQFFMNYGKTDEALAVCERAKPYQEAGTRLADQARAEVLTRAGRHGEAAETYRSMLASGGKLDAESDVRAALVRSLLASNDTAGAEKELTLADPNGKDLELQLMRSGILASRGDKRGARGVLDAAITAFPNQARVYVRRAELLLDDPAYARDGLEDLNAAIKLEPTNGQALQMRGMAKFRGGDVDGGLKDLRAAADADPSQVSLRLALVNELLNRGREAEAFEAAQEGINRASTNLNLAVQLGDTFAGRRLWPRAQVIYSELWDRTTAPAAAERYVSSLLRADQPKLAEAEKVLASPQAKTGEFWGLLLLRAEMRSKQGNEKAAAGDALTALGMAAREPRLVTTFYDSFKGAFPRLGQARKVLESMGRAPTGAEMWMPYYSARLRFDESMGAASGPDLKAVEAALSDLGKVLEPAKKLEPGQPTLVYMIHKTMSEMSLAIGRFDASVESGRAGLALNPEDGMLNNNVAYILADQLNKASEAIPLAEKAAQLLPNRADVLDTLGTVYLKAGDAERALAPLMRVVTMSPNVGDKAAVGVKAVRALVKAGKKDQARETLGQIKNWRTSDPSAAKRVGDGEIAELEALVGR